MFKLWRLGRSIPFKMRAALTLPLWAFLVLNMLLWWFDESRIDYLPLFITLSLAMMYEFVVLPSFFLYFVFRAKTPPKRFAKKGLKVAVISLCVPKKESLYIIEKQLKAMVEIEYPHDSWILDEGGNKEVKKLAVKYKVKYFTRKGIRKYNQPDQPFKKKTKAGNVNAWLDHVKRRKYEYFVQFDIDHLANTDYLNKTLGYFRDENIAWVQSPSIYRNRSSWIARGSSEQELVLQGPLQMGFYGHGDAPFIIGSHCVYRTSAINEIGGFQPTRAEDHLDTVALASKGYKGVFLPKIIAQGDGPESLKTYLAQQFAWAYSMFQVLIGYSPKLLKTMPFKQKFQFLFAQTWYPLWSLSYLALFFTPIVALIIKEDVAHVDLKGFVTHFIPLFIGAFIVWCAGRPLMQPNDLRLSWRGVLLHAIRWPVVLQAIIYAGFKVKRAYMITPKGRYAKNKPTVKVYLPFLALGFISSLAILFSNAVYGKEASQGQMIFALMNSLFMLSICVVDINLNLKQIGKRLPTFDPSWLKPIAATVSLALIIATTIISTSSISNTVLALFDQNQIAQKENEIPIDKMNRQQLIDELKKADIKEYKKPQPTFGVYNDPSVKPADIDSPHIVHIFIDWRDSHYLAQQLLENQQSDNPILITLEPRGDDNGTKLLSDIKAGRYDERLDSIFEVINAYRKPVYIRFAHEAELKKLYPWSNQDPSLYINAYRHTIDYSHSLGVKNTKWVWAPAGNPGAEAYYPGDKYVDVIGTTILHDKYWYGYSRPTFYEIAQQRLWLMNFKKPVWVVEFGAGHTNPEFQNYLINDALDSYKQLGFGALIYLNMVDANINGPNYTLTDTEVLNIKIPSTKPTDKKSEDSSKSKQDTCDIKNIGQTPPLFKNPYIYVPADKILCSE